MADNFAQAFFAGQDDRRNQQLRQQEQQRRNQLADLSISKEERAQQVDQRQALYSLAKGYKNYVAKNPDGGQQYYDRFLAPSLRGLGFGDVGPYDATAVGQVADQVLAAYAGTAAGSELAPRVVGNTLVDSSGRVLYQAPQEQDYQWSDRAGAWIPKPNGSMPGGMPTTNPITGTDFGIGETNNYVKSILGKVGQFDPNGTPEQQAERILPFLIQQESGGNPNAISPKGAQGLTQVMPATGQDPGFGVSPLQNSSPEENVRFGRDYLTAMLRRYPGRPDLALAAYNAGPAVADRFVGQQASLGGAGPVAGAPQGGAPLAAIPVAGIGPKVDTPDETFSQPQSVTFPDGTVRLVQFGNRGTRREVEGVAPPPTDRDAKPPTEGERKAATLLQRLTSSQQQLEQAVKEDKSAQSPNLASEVVRSLPLIGGPAANAITPEARQRVEAAQLDILDAALTLGTGAAYTREQLEGYRRSFFPQIGDSQGTIDDKAARLQNVIQAARIAAGRASPDNQERQQQGQPVRIQSAEDYNRLPSGTLFIAPDGTQRRKR